MLNIGFTELFIFAVIALLVLGPDKLPEAIRFVFKWYSKIKRTLNNLQNDLDCELRLSELRDQMELELVRIQSLESQVQEKLNFEPYRVCRRVNILRDYPDDKIKIYP